MAFIGIVAEIVEFPAHITCLFVFNAVQFPRPVEPGGMTGEAVERHGLTDLPGIGGEPERVGGLFTALLGGQEVAHPLGGRRADALGSVIPEADGLRAFFGIAFDQWQQADAIKRAFFVRRDVGDVEHGGQDVGGDAGCGDDLRLLDQSGPLEQAGHEQAAFIDLALAATASA